jgi:hypothetical protein
MKIFQPKIIIYLIVLTLLIGSSLFAEVTIYPTAILNFKSKGVKQEDTDTIPLLLNAKLTNSPNLILVEREELDKILTEQELNLSGLADEKSQIKAGVLVGAKIIITGTHFKLDGSNYIVAKIISTETSKVLGVSVNGTKEVGALVAELAQKINEEIVKKGNTIVAKKISREDTIKELIAKFENKAKPSVTIKIKEESLLSTKIDPAAETELCYIYEKLGGIILNKNTDGKVPDFIITGEGFCEFSTKVGKLYCIKSRLELKVVDKNGNIVASERVVTWDVDTAENIAAKGSLEKSGTALATAIFSKIIEKSN